MAAMGNSKKLSRNTRNGVPFECLFCIVHGYQMMRYYDSNKENIGLADKDSLMQFVELCKVVSESWQQATDGFEVSYWHIFSFLRDAYECAKQLSIFGGIEFDPLFTRFAIYPVESFLVVPFVETVLAPLSCLTIHSQNFSSTKSKRMKEVFREHGGLYAVLGSGEWSIVYEKVSMILNPHRGYNSALFQGNQVSIVHRLAYYGITLFAYLTLKSKLKLTWSIPEANLVNGALAASIATLITHPLDTLRTRITVQAPKDYKGAWRTFHDICRDDGFKSLYAGLLASLWGIIPSMAISVYVYKPLTLAWGAQRLTHNRLMINLLCGTLASLVASTVSFPMKVVQRRMQIEGHEDSNNMESLCKNVDQIVKNEGVGGLYRGIQPHCLKVVGSHIISFFAYEFVRVPCCLTTVGLGFMFDLYSNL